MSIPDRFCGIALLAALPFRTYSYLPEGKEQMTKRNPRKSGPGKPAGKSHGKPPGMHRGGETSGQTVPRGHPDARNTSRGKAEKRGKAPRDKRVWLFGHHPVTAALGNPNRWIQRLLATRQGMERLAEAGSVHDIAVEETDGRTLETLLPEGAVHQGLAALCDPLDPVFIEDIISDRGESEPVLILDQVTDPHNVGAILRSAAIFGAAAVIIQDRNAPPESGTLAKSASGALETIPLVRAGNLSQTIGILQTAGYWVVGLAGEAKDLLQEAKLNRKTAVVLGAEGTGLRRLTAERCDQLVRIPMAPNSIGSLNVSNAAAVALYEVWRATLPPAAKP